MSPATPVDPIQILLVEDNEGDARLAQEAFKEGKVANIMHHVTDGEEAMAFLRRQGRYRTAPRPDIILLDLNLSRKDGREVLADLKADDALRTIPVVVLTVSDDEIDILKTYNLHANCYITKPINLEKFIAVVTAIEHFWLTVVNLPHRAVKE